MYHTHDTDMWNVHRMFIAYITYNIGIPKHEKHDFLVQVRNFLLPLSLKVFRHKEREAQSFYASFFICIRQHVWHPPQGHCELAKVTLLLPTARFNSTDFSQISQNPPRALPVHDVIHIPGHILSLGFLFWHL